MKYNENNIYITRDGAIGSPLTLGGKQFFMELYSTEGEWDADQYPEEDYFDTGATYEEFRKDPKMYIAKAREHFNQEGGARE